MNASKLLLAGCVVCLVSDIAVQSRLDDRCQCISTTRARIPLKRITRLEVFKRNHSCNVFEVIVTIRTRQVVCLNPGARWVVQLVKCALQSSGKNPSWRQVRKCVRDLKKQRRQQRAKKREHRNTRT